VQAFAFPADASRPRVLARPAARPGVGRPRLHRGAHGRRPHPAPAQGARGDRARPPDRYGARRRVRAADDLNPVYRHSVALVTPIALAGLVVGLLAGAAWGWGAAAVGLGASLVYHLRHLARLAHWAQEPSAEHVPE